ncbi:MAG: carbon-nitrogen hydrolase family protein [Lachnospiraceae bacterium]|nr:carbon-nitrogen hydrolase family protein [Lachnospiraceae bacterium]
MIYKKDILTKEPGSVVTIATVNFHSLWGKKKENVERIKGYIEAAAKRGANMILFPEMALTGYDDESDKPVYEQMQYVDSEFYDGPSIREIAEVTKKYGVYTIVGYPERDHEDERRVFNAAFVTGPDGIVGSYRKIHVCVFEVLWAKKGREPLCFDTPWGKVGVSICGDTYNYHELTRYYASLGARIVLNPTAVLATDVWDYESYYVTGLESAVIENGIYMISSNFTGPEKVSDGGGCSNIIGPALHEQKKWYAGSMGKFEENIYMETVDLSIANRAIFKENPLNGEPDYRPEIYRTLCQRTVDRPDGFYVDRHLEENLAERGME